MDLFSTFTAIEEVFLDIITDGEQRAASRVGGRVLAVGAGYTLGDRSCKTSTLAFTSGKYVRYAGLLTLCDTEGENDGERGDELFEGHCVSALGAT